MRCTGAATYSPGLPTLAEATRHHVMPRTEHTLQTRPAVERPCAPSLNPASKSSRFIVAARGHSLRSASRAARCSFGHHPAVQRADASQPPAAYGRCAPDPVLTRPFSLAAALATVALNLAPFACRPATITRPRIPARTPPASDRRPERRPLRRSRREPSPQETLDRMKRWQWPRNSA